jgi:Fe-S-cluster containining protein
VSFYWTEVDDAPGGTVPVALTEPLTPHLRAMRGTNQKAPRCQQLQGEIGATRCGIYPLRPSPCREFEPYDEHGRPDPRCNRARERHGLAPLAAFGQP